MFAQIPYALFVISLFLAYGAMVRRGVVAGRAIIGVGVAIGVAAVAAAFFNVPPVQRALLPLPLLLASPLAMALCTAFCIWFAYRSQKIEDLAVWDLGDTRIVVRYSPAGRIEADALLLATSTSLQMLGGAAGAVGIAGGPALTRAARAAAPVRIGKVVATEGGRLAVAGVFHVAVHEPHRPAEEGPLRHGMETAAQQARKAGAETLAVPIGGLRGLATPQVAAIVAESVLKHRRAFSEIVFVALEVSAGRIVRDAVEQAVQTATPTLSRK